MTDVSRRRFTALAGAAIATPLFAPAVLGQGKPKLVVIGGGPGGGTVARYVNRDRKGAIEVTLIEPQKNFTTCFFSNIYVGGYRAFDSITHSYDKVRQEGVKIVHEPRSRSTARRSRSCSRAVRALRPARRCARDRHQVRLGARLF
jgi:NADPH-dependent 2,4-dienoyl-CoA reductase/sulfur reductase-like enzyme